MKNPEDFSVKQLLELFDNGSINVEQLNRLVRELRSAAHEQTPTDVLLKGFEKAVEEAELSGSTLMVGTVNARQLLGLARAPKAYENEIRQLTARAESAEAQIKAMQEQGVWEVVEYPSGTGELIVSSPDVNGVVIVRDESGEYRRVASSVIKKLSPAQQSPAVVAPELDNVEGNILPPIGASVAIHLASSDTWVDHTVVGYYVWGPLGRISDSYSRVFVRVVDGQGVLNARLLKDVKWDRNAAVRALQPSRPAEQSAVAVPDEDDYATKYMGLLSDVLDAKEVMRDAGVNHNVFSIMFAEYSKLISPPYTTEQSAVAVPDCEWLSFQLKAACSWGKTYCELNRADWDECRDKYVGGVIASRLASPRIAEQDAKNDYDLRFDIYKKARDYVESYEKSSGYPPSVDVMFSNFTALLNLIHGHRITEQDALEIIKSWTGHFDQETFEMWVMAKGRALFDKLNKRNGP